MSFLNKDQRGYWHLKERVNGKVHYLKYIGKDLKPYYASLGKGADILEAIKRYPDLATIGNGQAILAEYKRRTLDKGKIPDKLYRTIIVDPPWPMEKIVREARPNQFDFDYPVMGIDEIKTLSINNMAVSDGCHLYLWTTQKFLPIAFDVLEAWGVNYQCLLTWVKNVGFTPFSWMYSTEHCLFGHIGSLPLLKMGMRLDFQAKVREHSRKPDEFYDLVRLASPESRLDMFSREKREGFDRWGDDVDKFSGV